MLASVSYWESHYTRQLLQMSGEHFGNKIVFAIRQNCLRLMCIKSAFPANTSAQSAADFFFTGTAIQMLTSRPAFTKSNKTTVFVFTLYCIDFTTCFGPSWWPSSGVATGC
jgi:hypothetical protein